MSAPKNIGEALKNIAWMRAEIEQAQGAPCPTDEELAATRQEFLSQLPPKSDLWVFGYGSLIWNPIFEFAESCPARLNGYSRSFCIGLPANRGTMKKPGLMLALDEGHFCDGIAFRIKSENKESVLENLWIREMLAGVYVPRLLPLQLEKNNVNGLVFVAKKEHKLYNPLPMDKAISIIASAEGRLGTNRDYLFQLVDKLEEHSIHDEAMVRLCKDVKALVLN